MNKEFRLNSTGYRRDSYMKDDAILEKFIFNHYNKKPLEDGKLENRESDEHLHESEVIDDIELSNTTIQIDDAVSDCFNDENMQLESLDDKPKQQPNKNNKEVKQEQLNDNEEDSSEPANTLTELAKINEEKKKKPVRVICDEFHRILSLALLNRLTTGDKNDKLKDEEERIILDSSSVVELISLITGVERRKIVIHYKDPIPQDVGCFCTCSPDFNYNIKDIKDIKVNNEDMIYSYNAHYNALTNDFHISLTHMIHYNETQ